MGRAGAKRSKQAGESPTSNPATKKRKTEKKKISPKQISSEEKMDPVLKGFCEKFKHPEDSIQFLLQHSKMPVDEFFKNHWGRKPLVMEAPEANHDLAKIFSKDFLKQVLGQSENGEFELLPERDFLVVKVVDGKRKEMTVEALTAEILDEQTKEYAVQVNQPQRFQECLWSFMEKLECHLGSLVTSHVFLVPKDVKAQQKRFDNTEKFVLQLSGSSSWTLHAAKGVLRSEYSETVKEEDVGDKLLAATLKAGDVLYFPKGVIFESAGETDGVYIDFSTFQGMNHATLLNQTITTVIDQLSLENADLRRQLPVGYLPRADSVSNSDYADVLLKLAEAIRSQGEPILPPGSMIYDFMAQRLPPYGQPKFELEAGCRITPKSKISFRNKMHISWFARKADDADMNEDQMDEEEAGEMDLGAQTELVVISSVNNDRNSHMMIDSRIIQADGDSFTISMDYKEPLEKLYAAEEPISIESLSNKSKDAAEVDITILAKGLYNIGAISVSE